MNKYRVEKTGKKINALTIDSHGSVKDIKTGETYFSDEIIPIIRRSDFRIGFHVWRIGLYLYGREYIKYKKCFIVPGISIDYINGVDIYIDLEVNILLFGLGFRFIWIKSKK